MRRLVQRRYVGGIRSLKLREEVVVELAQQAVVAFRLRSHHTHVAVGQVRERAHGVAVRRVHTSVAVLGLAEHGSARIERDRASPVEVARVVLRERASQTVSSERERRFRDLLAQLEEVVVLALEAVGLAQTPERQMRVGACVVAVNGPAASDKSMMRRVLRRPVVHGDLGRRVLGLVAGGAPFVGLLVRVGGGNQMMSVFGGHALGALAERREQVAHLSQVVCAGGAFDALVHDEPSGVTQCAPKHAAAVLNRLMRRSIRLTRLGFIGWVALSVSESLLCLEQAGGGGGVSVMHPLLARHDPRIFPHFAPIWRDDAVPRVLFGQVYERHCCASSSEYILRRFSVAMSAYTTIGSFDSVIAGLAQRTVDGRTRAELLAPTTVLNPYPKAVDTRNLLGTRFDAFEGDSQAHLDASHAPVSGQSGGSVVVPQLRQQSGSGLISGAIGSLLGPAILGPGLGDIVGAAASFLPLP